MVCPCVHTTYTHLWSAPVHHHLTAHTYRLSLYCTTSLHTPMVCPFTTPPHCTHLWSPLYCTTSLHTLRYSHHPTTHPQGFLVIIKQDDKKSRFLLFHSFLRIFFITPIYYRSIIMFSPCYLAVIHLCYTLSFPNLKYYFN